MRHPPCDLPEPANLTFAIQLFVNIILGLFFLALFAWFTWLSFSSQKLEAPRPSGQSTTQDAVLEKE